MVFEEAWREVIIVVVIMMMMMRKWILGIGCVSGNMGSFVYYCEAFGVWSLARFCETGHFLFLDYETNAPLSCIFKA